MFQSLHHAKLNAVTRDGCVPPDNEQSGNQTLLGVKGYLHKIHYEECIYNVHIVGSIPFKNHNLMTIQLTPQILKNRSTIFDSDPGSV